MPKRREKDELWTTFQAQEMNVENCDMACNRVLLLLLCVCVCMCACVCVRFILQDSRKIMTVNELGRQASQSQTTTGTVSKTMLGAFLRDGKEHILAFPNT